MLLWRSLKFKKENSTTQTPFKQLWVPSITSLSDITIHWLKSSCVCVCVYTYLCTCVVCCVFVSVSVLLSYVKTTDTEYKNPLYSDRHLGCSENFTIIYSSYFFFFLHFVYISSNYLPNLGGPVQNKSAEPLVQNTLRIIQWWQILLTIKQNVEPL